MGGAGAAPNLMRFGQGHTNAVAELGQQFGVAVPDVLLPFLGVLLHPPSTDRKIALDSPPQGPGVAANRSRQKALVAASLPRQIGGVKPPLPSSVAWTCSVGPRLFRFKSSCNDRAKFATH